MSESSLWGRIRGAFAKGEPAAGGDAIAAPAPRRVVRIDFDMLLKGSVYDRPSGRVKQYGVTVDGATKVITSGDFVDRDTYDALIKAGAIRPMADAPTPDIPPHHQKRKQRQAS